MATLKLHRWGNPHAPALLCLHGFMGTGFDWDAFACAALSINPHLSILAPDLPGHGENSFLPADSFDRQILSLLEVEHLESLALIGYSLGGRLGLQSVLSHPKKFPSFVGISTSAGIDVDSERDLRKNQDYHLASRLRAITSESAFRDFLSEWWELPVFKSPFRSLESKGRFIASRLNQNPQALAESLTRWSSGVLPSLWDSLEGYSGRALFLAGAADEKYVKITRKMASKTPASEFQILSDVGHQILMENPLEAARCVVDFLQLKSQ